MTNVGFIGLGIMGRPMAGHLMDAGHTLFTSTRRTPAPEELLAKGLTVLPSPKDVAAQAEIIFTIVPSTEDVETVLFGESGLAHGLSSGKAVVDMSSISPAVTKEFAGRINALGCDYVDAPVSGGDVGAKAATLTFMVGASEAAFERVKPLLEKMGKTITRVGGTGHGQIAKVANQIIVALNIEAVAEALLFAAKSGADPVKVREALMGGFAASRVLDVHGERMIKRNFTPGARVEIHQKDLNLALSGAKALGISLPNTATAQELFNACVGHGGSAWDHSAMVRALEALANFRIDEAARPGGED